MHKKNKAECRTLVYILIEKQKEQQPSAKFPTRFVVFHIFHFEMTFVYPLLYADREGEEIPIWQ